MNLSWTLCIYYMGIQNSLLYYNHKSHSYVENLICFYLYHTLMMVEKNPSKFYSRCYWQLSTYCTNSIMGLTV